MTREAGFESDGTPEAGAPPGYVRPTIEVLGGVEDTLGNGKGVGPFEEVFSQPGT